MTNLSGGWKLLVLALVGYSILVTRQLLYLTDAAYRLAHEANFQGINTEGKRSLSDTAWGGESIGLINAGMLVLGLVALAALVTEIAAAMKRSREQPAG